MPNNGRKSAQDNFRKFSFPAGDEKPAERPVVLSAGDAFNTPAKKGALPDIKPMDPEADPWSPPYDPEQEQFRAMARRLLGKNDGNFDVQRAIEQSSDLDLERVIAAGLLEKHFRGRMDDAKTNAYIASALLSSAGNFDAISRFFKTDTINIVMELRMGADAKNDGELMSNLAAMELDTRNVFLALQIAGLEKLDAEMKRGGAAPLKETHLAVGKMIAAAGLEADAGLLRHAMNLYNEVSRRSEYTISLRLANDGILETSPWPDVVAEKHRKGPKHTPRKRPHTP